MLFCSTNDKTATKKCWSSDVLNLGNDKQQLHEGPLCCDFYFACVSIYPRLCHNFSWKIILNLVQAWWSSKMIRHLNRIQGLWARWGTFWKSPDYRACHSSSSSFYFAFFFVGKKSENFGNLRVRCVPTSKFGISTTNLTKFCLLATQFFTFLALVIAVKCGKSPRQENNWFFSPSPSLVSRLSDILRIFSRNFYLKLIANGYRL